MSKTNLNEKSSGFKQIPLTELSLNEANIICTIQQNEEPVEFVFSSINKELHVSCDTEEFLEKKFTTVSDFFNKFDKVYGTRLFSNI